MIFDKPFIEGHISKLNQNSQPEWGILTAQHMIEHLILAFRMAIEEYKMPIYTAPEKLERYQRSLYEQTQIPKLYQNPYLRKGELEDLEFDNLDIAKAELLQYFDKYETFFTQNPTIETTHVIFGVLNKEKWDLIQYKHLDHHFRQFKLK